MKDAERELLERALRAVEWGSCDGCSNGKHYCPECKAPRQVWPVNVSDEPKQGLHYDGCIVAKALDLPTDPVPT